MPLLLAEESIFTLVDEAKTTLENLGKGILSADIMGEMKAINQKKKHKKKKKSKKSTRTTAEEKAEAVDLVAELSQEAGPQVPSRNPKDAKKRAKKEAADTAGKDWYDLPATEITPEIRQDLRAIAMRNYMDPKRFYKKENRKKMPKYFQIGTVVEGKQEFYSARISKKNRGKGIVDEVLKDARTKEYLKRKFNDVQKERAAPKRRGNGKKRRKDRRD